MLPTAKKHNRGAFRAYAAAPGAAGSEYGTASRKFKIILVFFDCMLIGMQPIWVHLSKNGAGKYSYNPIAINLITELTKALASVLLLFIPWAFSNAVAGRKSEDDDLPMRPGPTKMRLDAMSILQGMYRNKLLLLPAGLYAVNNYLKFAMQLYFQPTTAKMLGNLKIFTIALLLRSVMKRSFTVLQWQALFLLVAGITVNNLSNCGPSGIVFGIPALACTLGSVTIPALASVYNEFSLKRNMEMNVHAQNLLMFAAGAAFNAAFLLIAAMSGGASLGTAFTGMSPVTWAIVVNNAAQGILSTFFFKFADTILKKYSSTIATVLTGLLSWGFFGHAITPNFVIGISIVFISMHQYFAPIPKARAGSHGGDAKPLAFAHSPSMDHVQLRGGAFPSTAPSSVDDSSSRMSSRAELALNADVEALAGSNRLPLLPPRVNGLNQ